ncbi:hypothetical protein PILCRDRAFT_828935 [Piloderma croceum F 1598]|uniref:Cyanovirin-N domain-containing protein n=1 Tax=Piloderma croceum (strain F 1598) TaxID=765440 RepID=A0A0C3F144_PILCF|nr:hypothetical protein PILCRDRAFT_828935 [Piloderma croceum F 1598]
MSFYETSRNVRLDEDNRTLRAECKGSDGKFHPTSIDLGMHLGNHNGSFVWHGENFNETARDVRLGGSMLYADLRSPEGTWNAAHIDLNKVVGNDDGQLVNAGIGGNR